MASSSAPSGSLGNEVIIGESQGTSSTVASDGGGASTCQPQGHDESETWLHPAHIKYTQTKISSVFSRRMLTQDRNADGPRGFVSYAEKLKATPLLTIQGTLQQLRNGALTVEQIPRIRVCHHDGEWWSLDNRRLWVFKEYGQQIPVIVEDASRDFFRKFDCRESTNGNWVSILEGNYMRAEMAEKQTLLNLVLKWSVETIFNENMFLNKVRPLPQKFNIREEYCEAFKWPLLDDLRGHLQQSLEEIGSSAFIPIRSIDEISEDRSSNNHFRRFKLLIDGEKHFVKRNKSNKPWKPKRTDLTILTTLVPESLEDLTRHQEMHCFAVILSRNEEENEEGTVPEDCGLSIGVQAYMHAESPEYVNIQEGKRNWFLVFFENLATRIRTWEALSPDFSVASPKIAKEILCKSDNEEVAYESSIVGDEDKLEEAVDKFCNCQGLNQSQTQAVQMAVISPERGTGRRVNLIQGPPGTGKTTTTTVLVSIVSCIKERMLVCAPTNRAISEVAERFLQRLEVGLATASQFCDFMPLITDDEVKLRRRLQLGDVIMVGNEDRLDTSGRLSSIFLPLRVQRLEEALSLSGWNLSLRAVVDFLRDGLEQFRLQEKLRDENGAKGNWNFLQFARNALDRHGRKMIDSGYTLCNDLPAKLLNPTQRKAIEELCDLMEKLLFAVETSSVEDLMPCFEGDSEAIGDGCRHCDPLSTDFCISRNSFLVKYKSTVSAALVTLRSAGLKSQCLRSAALVLCTTSQAGSMAVKQSGCFDYAIIDEAAQITEAEAAIVSQMAELERLVLVGDPKQLPALVLSKVSKECGFGKSLFERLQATGYAYNLLREQRRMRPEISSFPNRRFYEGAILDGPNVKSGTYGELLNCSYGAYAFINVGSSEEEMEESTKSWINPVEAEVVLHLLSKFRKDRSQNLDVGVITPYRGQVELLQKKLLLPVSRNSAVTPYGLPADQLKDVPKVVAVKTVDGFQGGESDVIIFSAVRSNAAGRIGFVEDAQRLNVAITRGKYVVWVIGNATTLEMHDELWRALIQDARNRGCFWNAEDDSKIKKLVVRVKTEREQFASLLQSDSALFQNAKWLVHFSKEFKNSITEMNCKQKRQEVICKLLNLANGKRSPYPTECASTSELYKKLIHVQPAGGLTLVWTVDVQKGASVKQVIKIWDIVEPSSVMSLVKRLEAGYATYTVAYLQRCEKIEFHEREKKTVVPAKWDQDLSFTWFKTLTKFAVPAETNFGSSIDNTSCLEKANVDGSVLLMKFYSLTSKTAWQLMTTSDGSKLEFLLEVSEDEADIITYPFTTFILGRSGTGKTTVITNRLMLKEMAVRSAKVGTGLSGSSSGEPDLVVANAMALDLMRDAGPQNVRQVIVTLSPKLCSAIKNHIAKATRTSATVESSCVADSEEKQEDDVMLDDDEDITLMGSLPDNLIDVAPQIFPLVITFRKFLAMVNGSVLCPFRSRKTQKQEPTTGTNRRKGHFANSSGDFYPEVINRRDTMQIDGEEDESELSTDEDSNEDLEDDGGTSNAYSSEAGEASDLAIGDHGESLEVTFELFSSCYWPRFRSELIKSFDPSVVFTEILSVIKGSLGALDSKKGRLTEDAYVFLASKRVSNFDEQQRKRIYGIFQQYEKLKSVRREYDIADYCTHLYSQLERGKYTGVKFHYVYVDEVQDLTMAQIVLFKHVCMDVERGFVFAGDTAQTIARGVSFRFEEIRTLFYTKFLGKGLQQDGREAEHQNGDHSRSLLSKFGQQQRQQQHMPVLHQLSRNFRTHSGIVEVANSIVQMLHRFFPNSVDKLDAESSLLLGDKPTFLEREDSSDFVTSLFGKGGASGTGSCDFGAEQVIVVRTNEVKRRLLERLGKKALVMTVLDCKGLEFQDVLVYNFFADSEFERKWRVVYSALEGGFVSTSFPQFNDHKHHLLMGELKQLYVVVTRSRQRLWFYDECSEYHKPMLDFWKSSNRIEVKKLDDDLIDAIHWESTAEEWKKRGSQFFKDKQYDMAEISFDRASEPDLAKYAKAFGIQRLGERQSDKKQAGQHFREAATIFSSLEKHDRAAKCYSKLGEHKTAGTIYRDHCKPPQVEDAAMCFAKGKLWKEAANIWRSLSLEQCLSACWHGKLLDLLLEVLSDWELTDTSSVISLMVNDDLKGKSPPKSAVSSKNKEVFESLKMTYLMKGARYHHSHKNVDEMMKFVQRFSTPNQKKRFLERRDYFDELMRVEEAEGNFKRAAELSEERGDVKHACVLLIRNGHHELALQKAIHRARFNMLWSGGKLGWPLIHTTESKDLLSLADVYLRENVSSVHNDLLQELQLLSFVADNSFESWDRFKESANIRLQIISAETSFEHWERFKDSTNVRLQVIAGRHAIESSLCHFENLLSSSHDSIDISFIASMPRLFSVWEIWGAAVISLIQVNSRAHRRRDTIKDDHLLENSLEYLGAVKQTRSNSVLVPDSRVSWLEVCDGATPTNQGQKCLVDCQQVYGKAEEFWASQLYQVGVKVVDMLERVSSASDNCVLDTVNFEWRGVQICQMYSVVQTLAEKLSASQLRSEEQHSNLVDRLKTAGKNIYRMSFPHQFNGQDFKDVLCLRHLVSESGIYDSIATYILQECRPGAILYRHSGSKLISIREVGRLQVLFPWLSREWIRSYDKGKLQKVGGFQNISSKDPCFESWFVARFIYGNMAESQSISAPNNCSGWLKHVEEYLWFVLGIHLKCRQSMDPFVFLHLLERGVVLGLACHTHLESCLLPESYIVTHMTGKNHEELYSAVLRLRCTTYCGNSAEMEKTLSYILRMLNSEDGNFVIWFRDTQVDRWYLPSLISRMVTVVLTICLNIRKLSGIAVNGLKSFFQRKSPFLDGMDEGFRNELNQIMWGRRDPLESQWRVAFTRALTIVGDPFVVTKHRLVDGWAHRLRIRKMRIFRMERGGRIKFRTDYQVAVASQLASTGERASSQTEIETIAPTGEIDEVEQHDDFETQEVADSWAPETEANYVPDELPCIPVWQVCVGDGQTVAFITKFRLLKCLERARKRLSTELTPIEKYERETHAVFGKWMILWTGYADFFRSEACPLKVEADGLLQKLESCVQILKEGAVGGSEDIGEALDEVADAQEALQKVIVLLDPRNEEHKAQNLARLQETIIEVKTLLQAGEKTLKSVELPRRLQQQERRIDGQAERNTGMNRHENRKEAQQKAVQEKDQG